MGKRKSPDSIERRKFAFDVRSAGEDGKPRLVGHAAVFNIPTVLVKADSWYKGSPEIREIIEPGAFAKSISEADQLAVWNHNTDIVLGRRKNQTLILTEDETGLANEIFPPDTALIRDMVLTPISRGDVNGESFGFRVVRDKWEEENNRITITLREIELVEVSPCSLPQYTETDIALSSRSADRINDFRQQRQAANQSAPGQSVHPEHVEPATPGSEDHPEESAPVSMRHLDRALCMRLEMLDAA